MGHITYQYGPYYWPTHNPSQREGLKGSPIRLISPISPIRLISPINPTPPPFGGTEGGCQFRHLPKRRGLTGAHLVAFDLGKTK